MIWAPPPLGWGSRSVGDLGIDVSRALPGLEGSVRSNRVSNRDLNCVHILEIGHCFFSNQGLKYL